MKPKLKECPFCGEPYNLEIIVSNAHKSKSYVVCNNCGATGGDGDNHIEAVAGWNARPEEDRLRAEIAQAVVYINALVEAMGDGNFLALIDSGKVDGIRAFLETAGSEEE